MTTPTVTEFTYEQYAAYATRVGAEPYTRQQWDQMTATHKALIARVAR